MAITAADVMDRSAALLNDTALSVFTYVAQLPFLNTALDELQEIFEQDNAETTNKLATAITVAAGTTQIAQASLPSDLVEIQKLYERLNGTTDPYFEMTRVDWLPQDYVNTESLQWWTYQEQNINFVTGGATTARQVLIEYIASLFTAITSSTASINLNNCKSFLAYRTAGLCAEFIGENPDRAQALNGDALLALDRIRSLNTKGRQSIQTRRRPFMAGYKNRAWW